MGALIAGKEGHKPSTESQRSNESFSSTMFSPPRQQRRSCSVASGIVGVLHESRFDGIHGWPDGGHVGSRPRTGSIDG